MAISSPLELIMLTPKNLIRPQSQEANRNFLPQDLQIILDYDSTNLGSFKASLFFFPETFFQNTASLNLVRLTFRDASCRTNCSFGCWKVSLPFSSDRWKPVSLLQIFSWLMFGQTFPHNSTRRVTTLLWQTRNSNNSYTFNFSIDKIKTHISFVFLCRKHLGLEICCPRMVPPLQTIFSPSFLD